MQEQVKLRDLLDNLTGFVETKIELIKFDIKNDVSKTLASLIFAMAMGVLFALFITFMSFAAALYLNHVMDHPYLGYLTVGLLYFLLFMTLVLLKQFTDIPNKLQKSLMSLFKQEE